MNSITADVTAANQRFARISALAVTVDEIFIEKARALVDIYASDPADILALGLSAGPRAYEKHFLFGDGMTSAWAFAWGPGASTPIHDHHCPCIVGVVHGAILEEWFEPIAEGSDLARLTKSHERVQGAVTALRPRHPNIHRMRNVGAETAITMHIYGYNHKAATSSIDREYRLA